MDILFEREGKGLRRTFREGRNKWSLEQTLAKAHLPLDFGMGLKIPELALPEPCHSWVTAACGEEHISEC